jgi:hypothetical protein
MLVLSVVDPHPIALTAKATSAPRESRAVGIGRERSSRGTSPPQNGQAASSARTWRRHPEQGTNIAIVLRLAIYQHWASSRQMGLASPRGAHHRPSRRPCPGDFARKIADEHAHEIERAKDTGNALAALQPAVERARKKLRRELGPQLSAQALLDEALEDVVAEAIAKRLARDLEAEEKLRAPAPPNAAPQPLPREPPAGHKATEPGVNTA